MLMNIQKGSIAITIERAFLRTLIPFTHVVFAATLKESNGEH
jgi:hypothetical protein